MVSEVNPILRKVHLMQKPRSIFLKLLVKLMNTGSNLFLGQFFVAMKFFFIFFEGFVTA
jgi:hypothetical protein